MNKLIIVTAPSGAGKTTIVHHLLDTFDDLAFSVSATNRAKRTHEKDGVDYYFFSTDEFKRLVNENAFLEYEEVYDDQFYGTLKREVERLWALGKCIIFDVDVKGALNIKKAYPEGSLTVFIKPPSKDILFERLKNRRTETPQSLQKRIARVTEELQYEEKFDKVIINDDLEKALQQAETLIKEFFKQKQDCY